MEQKNYRMANILNCHVTFLQIWNQYKAEAEACSFAGDGVFHCIGSVKGNLANLRRGFR